ncbi:MAG: hypothetical protein E7194_10635 [Erysipelotrichaceae bacterium]|nr:hypothetical protein [Erysipelotrichaceae bacterium]
MKKQHRIKNKALRIIVRILLVLVILAALGAATMTIAYHHRSDPKDTLLYETSNPHITDGKSRISAHRSGAGIAPEETMMAFRRCIENDSFDVDYFEFDLHITKDDVLVLLHDNELDRTSDCQQVFGQEHCRPEDYTFEQLKQLNMGAKFVNETGEMPYAELKGTDVPEDLRILDLDTILDYLEDNGHYNYIIEIKNDGDLGRRSMDILYADLKERNMLERCIFGCFISEISDYKDEMYPDFIRGPYGTEVVEFYFSALTNRKNYNPKFKTLQLPFNCFPMDRGVNLGTSTVINYAHAHDIAVQYWTVNNETDAAYLMSIGADAIITDYPDMVYRVREN